MCKRKGAELLEGEATTWLWVLETGKVENSWGGFGELLRKSVKRNYKIWQEKSLHLPVEEMKVKGDKRRVSELVGR